MKLSYILRISIVEKYCQDFLADLARSLDYHSWVIWYNPDSSVIILWCIITSRTKSHYIEYKHISL